MWVLARRTRKGGALAANTTARYLNVLLDLHVLRDRLSDGLPEHPFEGMEVDEILGGQAATGEIPHIPMDIAVPFLVVAVRWVREYGPEIAAALERCENWWRLGSCPSCPACNAPRHMQDRHSSALASF